MADMAVLTLAKVEELATPEGARLYGTSMRDRIQSLWRRMRRMTSTDDEEYREPVLAARGVEDRLADQALVRTVEALVRALPAKLRDPLMLLAGGDCTYEEMSAMLGVPSGTLKWRVMDARRRLKEQLAARATRR